MGSTLSTILSLVENQIDSGVTDTTTDPTKSLLTTYINNAIRRITRAEKPRELYSATVSTADITVNTNTVSIPSEIFLPDLVYYAQSSGRVKELFQKPINHLITNESAGAFFDTTNTGDPTYYDIKGTSFIFNKYFDRTATAAIKVYGTGFPTTLSSDSDTTELPIDYDLLIAYEAAILFYQKDDDFDNQRKFEILAKQEKDNLRFHLRTDDSLQVEMDPRVFGSSNTDFWYDPNIYKGT